MKVNLDRLSTVLSAILSDRYGVRVTVTVEGGKNEKDND